MAIKRHIALMRGINVGGKNKLPMVRLVAIFEDLGCENVRTYIQSGNVVFDATAAIAKTLAEDVSKRIAGELGLEVPVVVRDGRSFVKAVAANPFLAEGASEAALHVMFLADKPSAAAVKTLDADRSPGDVFRVVGRDIFLHCPNGVARTKLTNAYFDRALGTVSTSRNWRTVQTLVGMLDAES